MSGGDFFDTNVFIYLFDDADARKQATAQSLVSRALAAGDTAISFQVVQETLHVLTRKFTRQVTPEVAAQILQNSLLPLWRVQPSPALYARALALQERYAFRFLRQPHHCCRARSRQPATADRRPSQWPADRWPDHPQPLHGLKSPAWPTYPKPPCASKR